MVNTGLDEQKINNYFLIGVLTLAFILTFLVFRPYLTSFLLAMVLVVIFHPFYAWWVKVYKGRRILASITTSLIIALIILGPMLSFGSLLILEIVNTLKSGSFISHLSSYQLPQIFQVFNFDPKNSIENMLNGFLSNFGALFSNVAQLFIYSIITFISMIYLFRDGESITENLLNVLPFTNKQSAKLKEDMKIGIRAVIGGYVLVAIIQGTVSGIGFWIFGLPNPALFGFITMLVALLPTFGSSLVNIPAIFYLFFTHHQTAALGLAIWWLLAVAIIDNYIGPRFVSGRVKIHVLLLLFSIIGGIKLFGGLGFIVGPLIIIFLWSVLEMLHEVPTRGLPSAGLEKKS